MSQDPRHAGDQPPFKHAKEQDHPGSESSMNPRPDYGEKSYVGYGRLKNKVAVVTGADSGIGRAVALAYAREGADIVVSYLNEDEDANESKRVVEASGRQCLLVKGDLSQDAECKNLIEKTIQKFKKIDILVNNHAYQGKSVQSIEELDYERVLHCFKTNIIAFFATTRYAVPHMKPGSSIINTGSIQAYKPSAPILDYASTKGAITAFTKGLAQELVCKGIRVNQVAPGPVWTPLIEQSFPQEKNEQFGKQSPMQRPAQPVELAPSYVFLASNEGTYVNGAILGVTGGSPIN